jgi:hypothetical protein
MLGCVVEVAPWAQTSVHTLTRIKQINRAQIIFLSISCFIVVTTLYLTASCA